MLEPVKLAGDKGGHGRVVRVLAAWATYSLLVLAALIFSLTDYINGLFGDVDIEELGFYLFNGLQGTNVQNFYSSAVNSLPFFTCLCSLLMLPTFDIYQGRVFLSVRVMGRHARLNISQLIRRLALPYAGVMLLVALALGLHSINGFTFLFALGQRSSFIEDNYVNPEHTSVIAPDKKRNLIYIYLESMENTLAQHDAGGTREESLIPELEALATEPGVVSFSHTNTLGGPLRVRGTEWTVAAMVAHSGGIPLLAPTNVDGNDLGKRNQFLPGAYTLGDILKDEGYNQQLLIGSDAAFGGRDKLFSQHGDYEIYDYYTARQREKISNDYLVWWGYEDKKLFEYAKEELTQIAQQDKPFNFQILTADTHHVNGYMDETCLRKFNQQYDNVFACASAQAGEFVQWLKTQPFYDNTTVVLVGDHLGMQSDYFKNLVKPYPKYRRTTYNAILNSTVQTSHTKGRQFSAMDMFPTTLSALGYTIEGDKLGLGVDLFTDKKTLIEEYGFNYVNDELAKTSIFYNNKILVDL